MRADLERVAARFPDAVLSGLDGGGRPACVRCRPRYDRERAVLRCDRAPGVDIVDGPASLLWHSHDAKLARLRSFLVRGDLVVDGVEWVLTPSRMPRGSGDVRPPGRCRGVPRRPPPGRALPRRPRARPPADPVGSAATVTGPVDYQRAGPGPSEQDLASAFENAPIGMAVLTPQGVDHRVQPRHGAAARPDGRGDRRHDVLRRDPPGRPGGRPAELRAHAGRRGPRRASRRPVPAHRRPHDLGLDQHVTGGRHGGPGRSPDHAHRGRHGPQAAWRPSSATAPCTTRSPVWPTAPCSPSDCAHALARNGRHARPSHLFYLDLDGFKAVNDRFGHAAGDAVLTQLAQRIVAPAARGRHGGAARRRRVRGAVRGRRAPARRRPSPTGCAPRRPSRSSSRAWRSRCRPRWGAVPPTSRTRPTSCARPTGACTRRSSAGPPSRRRGRRSWSCAPATARDGDGAGRAGESGAAAEPDAGERLGRAGGPGPRAPRRSTISARSRTCHSSARGSWAPSVATSRSCRPSLSKGQPPTAAPHPAHRTWIAPQGGGQRKRSTTRVECEHQMVAMSPEPSRQLE